MDLLKLVFLLPLFKSNPVLVLPCFFIPIEKMDYFASTDDITMQLALIWNQIKAPLIVPLLRITIFLCLIMSVMMFIERVYMGIVITLVKLFGRKPEKRYKWEPIKDDIELGNSCYPMVLVQIPMYNEKEVLLYYYIKIIMSHHKYFYCLFNLILSLF